MTFERKIYYILKKANKPMTTTEIIEAITEEYCGNQTATNYTNYISKMELWAAELKQQNTSIKQSIIDALKIIVGHQYAKTWTTKEELGFYKGKRNTDSSCQYKTYTFRYYQVIKQEGDKEHE